MNAIIIERTSLRIPSMESPPGRGVIVGIIVWPPLKQVCQNRRTLSSQLKMNVNEPAGQMSAAPEAVSDPAVSYNGDINHILHASPSNSIRLTRRGLAFQAREGGFSDTKSFASFAHRLGRTPQPSSRDHQERYKTPGGSSQRPAVQARTGTKRYPTGISACVHNCRT